MSKRNLSVFVGVVLVAVLASTGCVTKKVFRKHADETDARIEGVQTGVESNERRIGDLGKDTDTRLAGLRTDVQKAQEVGSTALTEAQTAQKLAKGKILWTVTLSDDRVKFGFDQARIPAEARAALDDLAGRVKGMEKAVYVEIEGHTDNIPINTERFPSNWDLSSARSIAILKYFIKEHGFEPARLSALGYGEYRPIETNDTPSGRLKNRRVDIMVLNPDN